MHNGVKSLFAVSVLVLLAYAAMAAWPALQALTEPKVQSKQQLMTASAPATPTVIPLPRATGNVTAMPARSGTAHAATTPSIGNLSQPTRLTPNWDREKVRFAAYNVEMCSEPGGDPLRPTSLCKAPLTMLRGTRLLTVRRQGSWVLVSSPSAMLGWVQAAALTDKRPYVLPE